MKLKLTESIWGTLLFNFSFITRNKLSNYYYGLKKLVI